MSVKLRSGHRRHLNVCDQASCLAKIRRGEEIGCRRKHLDGVPARPHKPSHGLAKEPIILDDRNQYRFRHTVSNNSIEPARPATPLSVAPTGEFNNRACAKQRHWAMLMPYKFWFMLGHDFRKRAPRMRPNHRHSAISARKPWLMQPKSHGRKQAIHADRLGLGYDRTATPN
jgi:hypothetical protein